MKKNTMLSILLLLPVLSVSADEGADERGKEIFTTLCMTCHKLDRSPDMVAPPVFAVKNHYLVAHPDRDDFVMHMASWLETPDVDKTLMPGAVRRFKVMPPVELTESDREAVVGFFHDTDFNEPEWYAEHYQKGHGVK